MKEKLKKREERKRKRDNHKMRVSEWGKGCKKKQGARK